MIAQNHTDFSGEQIGNYQIKSLLTNRKVSSFFLAEDVKLGQSVYLEILNVTKNEDPELANSFQRRMESVSQIKHPNIAPVIEIDVTADGNPYAVIDYFPGKSLTKYLADTSVTESMRSASDALTTNRYIAEALSVAHPAGLIHHDLRPDNIWVREEDGTPVLVDLGVPIVTTPPDAVLTNSRAEMLDYAAPEVAEGKAISRRSNIYSLGIIIYEFLTGHRPKLPASSWDIFERSTMPKEVPLEEERAGLSGETYRLVRNCLWRQEWSRFETADELIIAIDTAILAEQSLPQKEAMWAGNSRRWFYVIPILAFFVLVFGLGFVWLQNINANQNPPTSTPTLGTVPTEIEGAVGVGDADGTVQPTATETLEAPPTVADNLPIPVITPQIDSNFGIDDTIRFTWFSASKPNENEHFAVYISPEDEINPEPYLIGVVTEPDAAGVFDLREEVANLPFAGGAYLWQVKLEIIDDETPITVSDPRRLFIIENTPTATATATTTEEPTPTPTLTEAVCTPTRPLGWIDHTVLAGETISTFAQRANVLAADILEANCLEQGAILSIGQGLIIPPPLATITPTPGPATATPTINSGNDGPSDPGDPSDPTATSGPPPTLTPRPPPVETPGS